MAFSSLTPRINILEDPSLQTDNVQATKAGLKAYLHGTTYNGGIAPTISFPGQSAVTGIAGQFIPYQMADGSWRMKFNLKGSFTGTSGGITCSIIGVTSPSTFDQALAIGSGSAISFYYCYFQTGGLTSNQIFGAPGGTTPLFNCSGDVALGAKPTWAY